MQRSLVCLCVEGLTLLESSMVDFVTYIVDDILEGRPKIVVADILEPIDDTVMFTYHLGEMPGTNLGVALTLQYSDAESNVELLSFILIQLPSWLIEHIQEGKTVMITDVAKNITIDLIAELREGCVDHMDVTKERVAVNAP